ncbi:4-diphosphocytidyl-2C-methyl-D-erythritol kinase [Parvibaculum lavamentivorans DS-1]|uniref:4-diphosphocytidyl-2-C-methyl-D-erythritol kinase n=1 Tax=Parvibaculum lavamentivorans (strain DS-1 / DSM 13023 / NCIMB 13966) TaxID=402881 RepID=ISPE_PARL1|nr:4-(cytidine 5'-diphospho)-2-C-methyl-D-erythritol kinase [Parvibaculum lavamentivorans]A7HR11.1 RecName: Full=4-diphosphocytidyl-2-C-methyl-D-erythritol kinase; Short=CMK; AltName: Full=4-(cytidine-5'-diphospho)-2-C-methyl-D-erythritol kinase [Parvibaculum lavamentivorans DS-1]ABS62344.1 4-diphosphocytidyl-2C-methyl-D-erythritol kinase [Parvibaculum lavamentivorans DS-1]
MSGPVTEAARAKINLTLRVLGKRADGYHELQSLVVFAQSGDRLTAREADELRLDVAGRFAAALQGEPDNLVLRAARMLREETGIKSGAHLTLEKNLPVASGIGGGSADAAAALRALTALWGVAPGDEVLSRIAAALGADVLVCLHSRTAMMWGKGEKIMPLADLPRFWLVLANAGIALSTAAVFRELAAAPLAAAPSDPAPVPPGTLDDLAAWLAAEGNDLEPPALTLAPEIGETISALALTAGCLLARMSGSGATCFGLYAAEEEAREAALVLQAAHPGWWLEVSAAGG